MTLKAQGILAATLVLMSACGRALGQEGSSVPPAQPTTTPTALATQNPTPESQPQLFDFRDSDIKFSLSSLMNVLRDNRHEGWVLAAYPDPKTSRPLIGAGFSLDVGGTDHPQRDPLNPHPFLEPSSAQLWQAAGLDSAKLQSILDQFDRELDAWRKKKFRKKVRTHDLSPQLTEEEATKLLRISTIQATYNARAYCRVFDQLTASQQMALTQLVFQMGVNLEEFTQFLSAVNGDSSYGDSIQLVSTADPAAAHWKLVQSTLIQSQWARRYSSRAVSVIAMFDPNYADDPRAAERKVQATLHPKTTHRHKKSRAGSVRAGNNAGHSDKSHSGA